MDHPMALYDIPGMGKGYRAERFIPRGTVLLEERPVILIPSAISGEARAERIETAVANMHLWERQQFDALQLGYQFLGNTPAVGRFLTNALHCEGDFNYAGLFLNGSRFNSSCTPNVHQSWNGQTMQFRAMTDILPSQELLISYDIRNLVRGRADRRARIRESIGYECQCTRCLVNGRESDERRLRIRRALAIENHDDHQFVVYNFNMIVGALNDLQAEGLHHYRDTLLYDAYKVCVAAGDGNNAMLWLRKAYDAAVVVVGEHHPVVRNLTERINAGIEGPAHFEGWIPLRPPPQ